jgi:hypothetical protein
VLQEGIFLARSCELVLVLCHIQFSDGNGGNVRRIAVKVIKLSTPFECILKYAYKYLVASFVGAVESCADIKR